MAGKTGAVGNIKPHQIDKADIPTETYSEADIALRLSAATMKAESMQPYLAMALYAMPRIAVPGLGTFASDAKWRFYYDPTCVMKWTVDQVAGAILHEVGHCVRGHADRFSSMNQPSSLARIYNIAGDVLINGDLRSDDIELPEGCVYVEMLQAEGVDVSSDMSAEQVYRKMLEKMEEMCTCGKGQSSPQNDNQDSDQQNEGNSPSNENGSNGDEDGESNGSSDSQQEGSEGGSQEGSSDGSGQGQNGSGGQQGTDPDCPIHGGHQHGNGLGEMNPNCGSAADGVAREYEAADSGDTEGVSYDRAEIIRDKIAVAVKEHIAARGTSPAGWSRWAEDRLNPIIDWRKELATKIRRTFANVSGLKDYTYSRPSRRASAMRNMGSGIILPAMRKPAPPHVAVVLDTSGSVSDEMLSWGIAEIDGILKSIGSSGRNVSFISCDAHSSEAKRIRNISDITLQGGGGTDMRIGITSAMEARGPKPQIVILITDGYTPYPDVPLKNATLIVALTTKGAQNQVPSWAHKILIER